MTQDDLAAGRFSKQYVSQIERGEVAPSPELLDWLARRLGVERVVLETGVAPAELERIRRELDAAQRLLDGHRHGEALDAFRAVRSALPAGVPAAERRAATSGETWALVRLGRVTEAAELLAAVRSESEAPDGRADERAELAYLTGICCYTISEMPAAEAEFARALSLLDESEVPDDRLRIDVHQWRSRCYRRQRDWEAAREDVERALDLCTPLGDDRRTAEVSFQASLVSYRLGRWVLARRQAETARDLYHALGDEVTKARVLNNLANLEHLLGHGAAAIAQLGEAFAIFVDADLRVEAGYVLASLAAARAWRARGGRRRGAAGGHPSG
jgi:tetratricopeptide (TPR) repeat protein